MPTTNLHTDGLFASITVEPGDMTRYRFLVWVQDLHEGTISIAGDNRLPRIDLPISYVNDFVREFPFVISDNGDFRHHGSNTFGHPLVEEAAEAANVQGISKWTVLAALRACYIFLNHLQPSRYQIPPFRGDPLV